MGKSLNRMKKEQDQQQEIIIYSAEDGQTMVEVRMTGDSVWLSQAQIAELFRTTKQNVSGHIRNILNEGELDHSVVKDFLTTASDGKNYSVLFYNLDMIIAVGYRVKSRVGTQFRRWATAILSEYARKGFAMNDPLLKAAGGGGYWKELLARIRDIRSSERVFYRQILEIYATSIDYDPNTQDTLAFFKIIQNKMHFAAHGHTAAEVQYLRANATKPFMGLTAWAGDKPRKSDVTVAKNAHPETLKSNLIAKKKNDGSFGIYEKYRKTTFKPRSIWNENSFLTETGTVEVKALGFNEEFDFPKPVNLIKQAIKLSVELEDDIVLDFFSGSATTAHATLELNKEDGSNRKFICVQLPEKCDQKSEAFNAGYATIADIAKERIRRVIKKIKEAQNGQLDFSKENQDLGFKVFKLAETNFKQWQKHPQNEAELVEQLELMVNPIQGDPAHDAILIEFVLKSGLPLTSSVEAKEGFYLINQTELAIVLDKATEQTFDTIIALTPTKVIALDSVFENNDQLKTNVALQFKDAGIVFQTI